MTNENNMRPEHHTEHLIAQIAQGLEPQYLFFWGHQPRKDGSIGKTCFSQWFEAPFTLNGIPYATAEHYMMAEKARLFGDEATLAKILAAPTPAHAKKLGREVAGFDNARWEARGFDAVVEGNVAKFTQNPAMGEFLRTTGDRVLVEASPVDRVWGIGLADDDPRALHPAQWQGHNLLGFALMRVREVIREARP